MRDMKIKESSKCINGVQCVDVVSKGKRIKTFINRAQAEAFIAESKIENYTKSSSYKEEMAFVNYYAGESGF